jgi:hypothetical protein
MLYLNKSHSDNVIGYVIIVENNALASNKELKVLILTTTYCVVNHQILNTFRKKIVHYLKQRKKTVLILEKNTCQKVKQTTY